LETSKKEFVELKTELQFLKAYVFLVKMRFGENLKIEIIENNSNGEMIIPLCLQMLIENSIKHNIISSDEPLTVTVEVKDKMVIVRNNLQRKNIVEHSTGLGLENIKSRYEHLKKEQIEIEETKEYFQVSVPLIFC
jgi:LytS/YehU family sensor histidine kinase